MKKQPIKSSASIPKIAWLILFLILAYFLWMEHRAHVIAYLPTILIFLFLLLCPLMHLFMHYKHREHHNDKDKENNTKQDQEGK